MNNKVVIISHNQGTYLLQMIASLESGIDYVVVLDRCTDNSEMLCLINNINFINTGLNAQGFYAGYARNCGAKGFDGNILFLDGDRVPQFKVTNEFISAYASKWDMSLLRDMTGLDTRPYLSHGDIELEIPHSQYCHIASCGMILNRDFITKIRLQNGGEIFNPIFDGAWGCEDSQLGDLAFFYKASVGFITDTYTISGFNLEQTMAKVLSNAVDSQHQKRLILKDNLISKSFTKESIIDDDTPFCIRPFTSLTLNVSSITPCNCVRSFLDYYYEELEKKTASIDINNVEDVWSSDVFDRLRKSIKYNKHWFCTYGTCSYKYLHSVNDLKTKKCKDTLGEDTCKAIIKYIHTDNVYEGQPIDITLNHSNACNLRCKHCRTELITKTTVESGKVTRFIKTSPFFSKVTDITLSGTGEPLFDKELNSILKERNTNEFPNIKNIHILTNGTLLTEDILNQIMLRWEGAKIGFTVSFPGSNEELSHVISPGFNFDVFKSNLGLLSSYKQKGLIAHLEAVFVYQKDNFRDLQNVVNMLEEYFFDKINVQYIYKSCWCTDNVSPLGVVTTNKVLFDEHENNIRSLKTTRLAVEVNFDYKSIL